MNEQELKDRIEALVDSSDVDRVIDALAQVCREKAQHIDDSWQDPSLAREWTLAAKHIEIFAPRLPICPGIREPRR